MPVTPTNKHFYWLIPIDPFKKNRFSVIPVTWRHVDVMKSLQSSSKSYSLKQRSNRLASVAWYQNVDGIQTWRQTDRILHIPSVLPVVSCALEEKFKWKNRTTECEECMTIKIMHSPPPPQLGAQRFAWSEICQFIGVRNVWHLTSDQISSYGHHAFTWRP